MNRVKYNTCYSPGYNEALEPELGHGGNLIVKRSDLISGEVGRSPGVRAGGLARIHLPRYLWMMTGTSADLFSSKSLDTNPFGGSLIVSRVR